jgi:hypothetical protein
LSGDAAGLNDYQFVNSPEQPLQALSDSEREAVFAKLAAAIERIVHHGGDVRPSR